MNAPSGYAEFGGKRVLIVESELLVPFTLYRAVEQLGAVVVGPVAFPEDVSMLVGDSAIDGAILDSRMRAQDRLALQRFLRRLHIPYVEVSACMSCIRGRDGCYRLCDAEADLVVLGRALFGGSPSGTRHYRRPARQGRLPSWVDQYQLCERSARGGTRF